MVVEDDGAPLIISAGDPGRLRSRRLDGSVGPFNVTDPHIGGISKLVVVEDDGACEAVSPDNERSHLGGRKGRLPTMTFEQLLEAAHWTPEIFAAIDAEVDRQRAVQEDMAIADRDGQLDLFATT